MNGRHGGRLKEPGRGEGAQPILENETQSQKDGFLSLTPRFATLREDRPLAPAPLTSSARYVEAPQRGPLLPNSPARESDAESDAQPNADPDATPDAYCTAASSESARLFARAGSHRACLRFGGARCSGSDSAVATGRPTGAGAHM